MDGRLRDDKKDSTIKTFLLFFRVRTFKPQLIEKPRLFSLFSSFSLSVCSKAVWVLDRTGFFRTGSRQPVRLYGLQLSLWFLWGLCVWGCMGLMMNIMHKWNCEEFVNVSNISILSWLTADSKRMEYSVNVTKLVKLLSSISDFWSMVFLSSVGQLLYVS